MSLFCYIYIDLMNLLSIVQDNEKTNKDIHKRRNLISIERIHWQVLSCEKEEEEETIIYKINKQLI